MKALIHVRDTEEEVEELYPSAYETRPPLELCEIREYYCPGCGNQLEVEVVPFGYPIIFDFLPDLDTFYREWLESPPKNKIEFKEYNTMDEKVFSEWGIIDALFIDGKEIRTGPPPSYGKIKKLIAKRVKKLGS